MTLENTPKSVESDGTFRLWFVPDGSNPKSAAILNGATAKSITYSMVPGGFKRDTNEETVSDERLSLKQMLERPGSVTDSIEVQYVFGDEDDVANAALAEGVEGSIVARYAVPNETDATAAQLVDIAKVRCGKQRKNQPVRNGVWVKTQKLFVIAPVEDDVALIA